MFWSEEVYFDLENKLITPAFRKCDRCSFSRSSPVPQRLVSPISLSLPSSSVFTLHRTPLLLPPSPSLSGSKTHDESTIHLNSKDRRLCNDRFWKCAIIRTPNLGICSGGIRFDFRDSVVPVLGFVLPYLVGAHQTGSESEVYLNFVSPV